MESNTIMNSDDATIEGFYGAIVEGSPGTPNEFFL